MKNFQAVRWPATAAEAIALQKKLAHRVAIQPLPQKPKIIAAIDMAHIGPPRRPTQQGGGIVVYDIETRQILERHALIRPITFPYIPGLLSFREAPLALELTALVKTAIDVYLLDGQGLAHPRRLGIASHFGVLMKRPAVGCAKSRLCGRPEKDLPELRGSWVHLIDKNEIIGALVRTRDSVKPLYVSIGNLVTLPECIEIVLNSSPCYRLPEPARAAHNYVTMIAHGELKPDGPASVENRMLEQR